MLAIEPISGFGDSGRGEVVVPETDRLRSRSAASGSRGIPNGVGEAGAPGALGVRGGAVGVPRRGASGGANGGAAGADAANAGARGAEGIDASDGIVIVGGAVGALDMILARAAAAGEIASRCVGDMADGIVDSEASAKGLKRIDPERA